MFFQIGSGAVGTILIFTIVNLNGVNFENMYEIYKKYGFWKWDMNALFIMMPAGIWIPVALYFSSRDLGEKLTKLVRTFMQIDIPLSGKVICNLESKAIQFK